MKTSRHKKARKNLGFYINNYKFYQPFQVLIDGTFAFAALENKFNIQDQITKYFQSEVKLLTTPCIISETEKLGLFSATVNGAMQIVKQYAIHKCRHIKQPVSGLECLQSMIGKDNNSRYIVATQDRQLQGTLRTIPGVPIVYLHGKAPILESPSEASYKHAEIMQENLGISIWEKDNVKILKKQAGIMENEIKERKKKKKKGLNPLSCRKKKGKKMEPVTLNTNTKVGNIKRKKKIKIAQHIKEALMVELSRSK